MDNFQKPAPSNALHGTLKSQNLEGRKPSHEQDRVGYGQVSRVDDKNGQVFVRLYEGNDRNGNPKLGEESKQSFPISNQMEQINKDYGMLRENLAIRITWRGGQLKPNQAVVDIIGDENYSLVKKAPRSNLLATGPFKILSGGQMV